VAFVGQTIYEYFIFEQLFRTTTTVKIPFPSQNPKNVLQAVNRDIKFSKSLHLDKFMKNVLLPFIWLLPTKLVSLLYSSRNPQFQIGLTSIIGCENQHSFCGSKISKIYPLLCFPDNNPLFPITCFTFSHTNQLNVTIAVDTKFLQIDKKCLHRWVNVLMLKTINSLLHEK